MTTKNAKLSERDHRLLTRALELAENGLYTTTPNPRVGCVICRHGEIIAEAWHERSGDAHAEVKALAILNGDAAGAEVFVSLEPCAHQGKTPPCVDALIAARPARVVVAMQDPNPAVAGRGLARLHAAGIPTAVAAVNSAVGNRARELNIGFIARMTRQMPWRRLKIAATLDGKTALASGLSRWISGEESRRDAHRLRARSCAVMTGIGTTLEDNPMLNVRAVTTPRQPLRVLVDSALRVSPTAAILRDAHVVVATAAPIPPDFPATVVSLPDAAGKVDLKALLHYLAVEREINELTIEAGRKLNGALLTGGYVDEIVVYLAPLAFGSSGKGMFHFPTPETPAAAPHFTLTATDRMENGDLKLVYRYAASTTQDD